jgi:hypothetical protein
MIDSQLPTAPGPQVARMISTRDKAVPRVEKQAAIHRAHLNPTESSPRGGKPTGQGERNKSLDG